MQIKNYANVQAIIKFQVHTCRWKPLKSKYQSLVKARIFPNFQQIFCLLKCTDLCKTHFHFGIFAIQIWQQGDNRLCDIIFDIRFWNCLDRKVYQVKIITLKLHIKIQLNFYVAKMKWSINIRSLPSTTCTSISFPYKSPGGFATRKTYIQGK